MLTVKQMAQMGGRAAGRKMSKAARVARARAGATARWAKYRKLSGARAVKK